MTLGSCCAAAVTSRRVRITINIITVRWLRAAADEGRCRVVAAAATVCGAGDNDRRWRPCFGYRCEMCEEKRVRGMRLDTALSQLRSEADEEMWACVCVG
jgi:hypothetical protein